MVSTIFTANQQQIALIQLTHIRIFLSAFITIAYSEYHIHTAKPEDKDQCVHVMLDAFKDDEIMQIQFPQW